MLLQPNKAIALIIAYFYAILQVVNCNKYSCDTICKEVADMPCRVGRWHCN